MLKRMKSFTLMIIMLVSTMYNPHLVRAESEKISGWALDEINEARYYNLVIDSMGKDFTKNITRQAFCQSVVKLIEVTMGKTLSYSANPFMDTSDPVILKAYHFGIVKGTSATTFSPNADISRQEIAVMIVNAIKKMEVETGNILFNTLEMPSKTFSDESSIASWALDSIRLANKYEIMNGIGDGKIGPKSNTTIEQAVIMIKRVYEKYVVEKNKAEFADNTKYIREDDAISFYESITKTEYKEDGNQIITFSNTSMVWGEAENGSILFIEATEENPYGFIGKIENMEVSSNFTSITFSTPLIDEVFSELDLHINQILNANQVIGSKMNDYVTATNSKFKQTSSAESKERGSVYYYFDKLNSIKLGIEDAILYDSDKNYETENDQLKVSGGISLSDIKITGDVDLKDHELSEVSLITSINEIGFDLDASFGMDKSFEISETEELINGGNGYKIGPLSLEGVDMTNTLVLGAITFDLATLTPIVSIGEVTKLPLAVVVMLSLDISSSVNATVSTTLNYKAQAVSGLSITAKSLDKVVQKGDVSYSTDKYNVNEYKSFTTKDSSHFDIQGSASGELTVTIGPEVGLMVGGIIPITVKNHGGVSLTLDAKGFMINYDQGEWQKSGPGLSAAVEISKYTQVLIRLMLEIEGLPFLKVKTGFDYRWSDQKVLWSKSYNSEDESSNEKRLYKDICVGYNNYLALDEYGNVFSWGDADSGALGIETANTGFVYEPSKIEGLSDIEVIEAGYEYSVAIDQSGKAWLWGNYLQSHTKPTAINSSIIFNKVFSMMPIILEDNNGNKYQVKEDLSVFSVTSLDGVIQIYPMASEMVLLINEDGSSTVRAYIDMEDAVFTNIDTTPTFIEKIAINDVKKVIGGVVLKNDGTIWRLEETTGGSNKYDWTLKAELVEGLPLAKNIYYHENEYLSLLGKDGKWYELQSSGSEYENNFDVIEFPFSGTLETVYEGYSGSILKTTDGDYFTLDEKLGSTQAGFTLREVISDKVTEIDGSVALSKDGSVYGLGMDGYAMYSRDISATAEAVKIAGLSNISKVDYFNFDSLIYNSSPLTVALNKEGKVFAWGNNDNHCISTDSEDFITTPTEINGLKGVIDVAAGNGFIVGLKKDGTVIVLETDHKLVNIKGASNIVSIEAGNGFFSMLRNDGVVLTYGKNNYGQLGNGSTAVMTEDKAIQVSGLSGVVQIETGVNHTLALTSSGTVMIWGKDPINKESITRPEAVDELMNVVGLGTGETFIGTINEDNKFSIMGSYMDEYKAYLDTYHISVIEDLSFSYLRELLLVTDKGELLSLSRNNYTDGFRRIPVL